MDKKTECFYNCHTNVYILSVKVRDFELWFTGKHSLCDSCRSTRAMIQPVNRVSFPSAIGDIVSMFLNDIGKRVKDMIYTLLTSNKSTHAI